MGNDARKFSISVVTCPEKEQQSILVVTGGEKGRRGGPADRALKEKLVVCCTVHPPATVWKDKEQTEKLSGELVSTAQVQAKKTPLATSGTIHVHIY